LDISFSYAFIVIARDRGDRVGQDRHRGSAAERLRDREPRQVQPYLAGRVSHPDSVRRKGGLPAQPQGNRHRHRGTICITRDNVQVGVDAVLYMQVLDPHLASYGITNFGFAISQLAQTTLRSEIGKIELDRTFEARGQINTNVVSELDKASAAWGVKVLRYEIKNITPPKDVLSAMEKQMRAEREKRAVVLASEGERDAKINAAEGDKQTRDQAIGSQQAATDQRSRRSGAGHSGGRDGDGGRLEASRHCRSRIAAASRPCSCASARNT